MKRSGTQLIRSALKKFSNETSDQGLKGPVFVVGSGRSGTSVMLSTVRKTLDWKYHGEGHFYPLFHELNLTIDNYFESPRIESLLKSDAHMIHHVRRTSINRRLARMTRELFFEVYGTTEFVDKTPGPESILSLPLLQSVFPEMKIIHMKRRGIEVVRSALKKFDSTGFEAHCKIWERSLVNWDKIEPRLEVPHITIDLHTITTDVEAIVKQLEDFLDLNPEQALWMLNFFENDRPQSSGNLNTGDISLATSGWSDEEVAIFRRIGKKMMARHGWSEDEGYFT